MTMKKINIKIATFLGSIFLLSFFLFFGPLVNKSQAAISVVPNISVSSVDSEQSPTYAAANAVDGDSSTFWHTHFIGSTTPQPHNIVLDLGKNYLIGGLHYLPRQDGGTYGIITKYSIYTSTDNSNWETVEVNGTFAENSNEKEILFSNKTGRYVKFVSLAEIMGTEAAAAAEIEILGFNTDGTAIEETPPTPEDPLPVPNISVSSVDSQQLPNYPTTAALDGNANTFWHTHFIGSTTPQPHNIVLDLGNSYPVDGFRYLPRQDGSLFGTITQYEIYVSDNPSNWGTAVSTGSFASNSNLKEISFTAKNGRYVKLISLAEAMGSVATSAAEIQAIGTGIVNKEISYTNLAGPEISVGLWVDSENSLNATPLRVEANKKYNVKDSDGDVIAVIDGGVITKVSHDANKDLKVYNSIPERLVYKEVFFDAADGNSTDMIFNVHRPNSSYDQYRGKIKIRYTDSNNIWIINTLPMEQYVWGMGETTGTGPIEHTKLMTTIFRTYGYQYVSWASTKWVPYGFRIRSDSGSQIYRGYDWEIAYPNIKLAAQNTKGNIATYGGNVALTPYSSWTDGRTRSFEERWGSDEYPWCKSVSDPYGKHPTLTTAQLEAAGNHMVGVSANGSLKLAGSSYGWDYQRILKYYYTGINITTKY